MAPSYQNFPAPQTGTIPSSSATEIWYSATTGSDSNSGASSTAAIKTITQLGRMMWGFGNTGSAVLYTDAALSDSESTLFYQMTANDPRQWSTVSGTLPSTPKLWFDARDINGNGDGNVGFTNGQVLAAMTWVNKGTAAGGNATMQASTVTYRSIASAGKMRNSPAIEFAGAGYLKTANDLAGFTGPSTWVAIFMVSDGSVTNRIFDGSNNSCGMETNIGTPPSIVVVSPSSSGMPAPQDTVVVGKYNYMTLALNPSAPANGLAVMNLNGVQVTGVSAVGGNFANDATIGAWNDGSAPYKGQMVSLMLFDGAVASLDVQMLDQWVQYNYGTGFPQ